MISKTMHRSATNVYRDNGTLLGELWLPDAEMPALVTLIHGGFWRSGKSLDATKSTAASLAESGFAVWNIEYRAGSDVFWRTTLQDVAAAVDHTATLAQHHGICSARPVVVGHSAGAQLALWSVARSKRARHSDDSRVRVLPSAVVSLGGICDMVTGAELQLGENAVADFLEGPPHEQVMRYQATCPTRLLPLGVRQVVVHGAADDRVPVTMSRRYAQAATFAGDAVEFVELPGAGHRSLIEPESASGRDVVALIARVVREMHSGHVCGGRETNPDHIRSAHE